MRWRSTARIPQRPAAGLSTRSTNVTMSDQSQAEYKRYIVLGLEVNGLHLRISPGQEVTPTDTLINLADGLLQICFAGDIFKRYWISSSCWRGNQYEGADICGKETSAWRYGGGRPQLLLQMWLSKRHKDYTLWVRLCYCRGVPPVIIFSLSPVVAVTVSCDRILIQKAILVRESHSTRSISFIFSRMKKCLSDVLSGSWLYSRALQWLVL